MIKTNIKMRVTPEQSRKVQEICFENGIYWRSMHSKDKVTIFSDYLYIDDYISHDSLNNLIHFKESNYQEIDADLFIKTNGTCEESSLNELYEKVIERVNEHQLQEETYLTKYTSQPKDLESALKKIENLHIALKKKVDKNKNQALEITKLLKDKEEYKEFIKSQDEMANYFMLQNAEKELIIKELAEQLKEKETIISYLEGKLK